jgi:uncharacterized protein YgiM (DUF1202 family)
MRKNLMKIGTMAMAVSMLLTPVSTVFAADESREMVTVEESNTVEMFTGTSVEESSDEASESNTKIRGIFSTAYIVTASSLHVRSGRGTSYSIIGSLTKGQTVYVYNGSLSNGWVKIKFAGSTGYVSAQYIEKK